MIGLMNDEPIQNDDSVVSPVEEKKELPADATNRTRKEFEKLTENNHELKKELDKERRKNVLESLRPDPQQPFVSPISPQVVAPNVSPQEAQDIYANLVDTNGYVDVAVYKSLLEKANKTAQEASDRASRAEAVVMHQARKQQDFEESRTMQEVHKQYPELDPNSEMFNPLYFDAVRDSMVSSLRAGIDDPSKVMEAARKYAPAFRKTEVPKEVKPSQEVARAVIRTTPKGTATQGKATAREIDDLITATRHGDSSALAERLKRSGY